MNERDELDRLVDAWQRQPGLTQREYERMRILELWEALGLLDKRKGES